MSKGKGKFNYTEEHKMSKNVKDIKKLGLTTAALAGTVLAGGATISHADTVKSQTMESTVKTQSNVKPQEQAVQDQQSKVASDTSVVDTTKAQADKASSTVKATQATVASQQSKVNADKATVSSDQSNVSHWQSVSKDATPANISANKQAQASQQSKISADKSTISSQQKNVDSAQSQVNSAQSNLNDKKAEQSSAQTNYNNAQNDYNKAKQNADNIQSAISDQQSTVSKDKQNISDDNSQISGLNNSIANDKTAISDTQSAINNVSQKAQDDQAKLSRDENSLSDAQSQKTNDENKVSKIQNEINYMPVAPTIPDYDKSWMGNPNSTSADISSTDDEVNADMQSEFNAETANSKINDPSLNYYVDAGNLSASDLKILNERLLIYLNQFRKQLGLAPLEYNSEVASMAKLVAQVSDNDKAYNSDDTNAFNALQNDYHLNSPHLGLSDGGFNVDENHITMNQLVNQGYNAILDTLFADTSPILAHMHYLLDNSGNVLVGFAMDEDGGLRYVDINSINGDASPYEGKSEAVPDVSQLQSDLANAKQKVADDDTAIQQLQNAVNADKAQLAQDTPSGLENQLSQQKAKLAQDTQSLQDAQNRLSMDEQKLTQDENTLSQLQQEANDPQKVLDTLANKVATAKTALDNANNAVAQAQQAYDTAEANLQKQQQILSNDEAQLKADEAELAKLQQTGQDYAVAPQKLAQAEQKLAQDVKTLQADEALLSQLEAELAKDKANEAQAQQAYEQALAKLNADKAELAKQEEALDPATKARMASEARVSGYNKAFAKVEQAGGMETVKADTIKGASVKSEKRAKKGLPDTGDSQNTTAKEVGLLGLAGAGLLATLGIAGDRKRKAGRHF